MTDNNQNQIMKSNALDPQTMEMVLLGGDLSKLSPAQRLSYYRNVCESVGLNPLTRPFDYISLNGKLTLYAKKDATDQLRRIHNVSVDDVNITETEDQFIVKVKGHDSSGRSDVELGVVNKKDMRGDTANAQMKAVTKAKRRLTLSLCGLGWLDETEVQTIPDARPVAVNDNTGEIVEQSPLSYDDAKQIIIKTKGGERLMGELSKEQLDYIIENGKNSEHIEAARLILKHDFNME